MGDHHAKTGYEKRDVHVSKIAIAVLVPTILIIACLIGLDQWLKIETENVYYNQVLNIEDAQYKTLVQKETLQLDQYKILDKQKATVRIPVKQAMSLIVQEGQ